MSLLEFWLAGAGLASFFLISVNIYSIKRKAFPYFNEKVFQKEIAAWHIFAESPSPELYAQIKQRWSLLQSMLALGAGLGMAVMAIILIGIALATSGTIGPDGSSLAAFFMPLLASGAFIGLGLGGLYALSHLTIPAPHPTTSIDLHQQHYFGYKNRHLAWFPLITLAETLALTVFFAPHLTVLRFAEISHAPLDLPYSPWLLAIVPIAIALQTIASELLISQIAREPRFHLASDPVRSLRLNDMFRATIIGILQIGAQLTAFIFAVQQFGMLASSLWASGYWTYSNRPYYWLVLAFLLLAVATQFLGFGLTALHNAAPKRYQTSYEEQEMRNIQ